MTHITSTNKGLLRAPYGTIGNAIRKLRQERQWTQERLAKKLDVTQSAIASYESGRICPSLETAQEMAYHFDVPLEFILGHKKRLFDKDVA